MVDGMGSFGAHGTGDEASTDGTSESAGRSPGAREIKRIVDVAMALGIDPQIADAALRGRNGEVPTECPLVDAIQIASARLNRDGSATRRRALAEQVH